MKKLSKKYQKALDALKGKGTVSTLSEAVSLLKESSVAKFNSTAEVHFNLNIDPKKADQIVRTTVLLPHGTGKTLKIAAVVSDEKVKEALEAGAVSAGLEDLIAEFEKGKFNYDVVVASPDVMKKLAKVAKTLGQKGLMPSPKSGTVTTEIVKTIKELNGGRIELRNDKEGNIHSVFGKLSFSNDELENNLKHIMLELKESKPSGVKGIFMKSLYICSTMGPSIKLDITELFNSLV